jgi:hypothetical protein
MTNNKTEAALYIEVGKIIDEAGSSLPTLARNDRLRCRFLELADRYGVHEVKEALSVAIEYGPLYTAWDRHELKLAEYALLGLAQQ